MVPAEEGKRPRDLLDVPRLGGEMDRIPERGMSGAMGSPIREAQARHALKSSGSPSGWLRRGTTRLLGSPDPQSPSATLMERGDEVV